MASKKQLRYQDALKRKANTGPPNFDDDSTWGSCPDCGAPLKNAGIGGGEACTKCDYWFCY